MDVKSFRRENIVFLSPVVDVKSFRVENLVFLSPVDTISHPLRNTSLQNILFSKWGGILRLVYEFVQGNLILVFDRHV